MLFLYPFRMGVCLPVFWCSWSMISSGEEMDNIPTCVGERCFAFCMQDIPLAEVDIVRPYLPSRIFVRDGNTWRAASEVFTTIYVCISFILSCS